MEEMIEASISPIVTCRSSSRLRSAAPSWSEVDWRTVAKRPCSVSLPLAEGPEVGLGVANVHGEQHERRRVCERRARYERGPKRRRGTRGGARTARGRHSYMLAA